MDDLIAVEIEVTGYRLESNSFGTGNLITGFISGLGLNQIGASAPHFIYSIQVTVKHPILLSFEVSKRFSELAKLDDSLSQLTKFLPFFPPRGAQRILTDEHAKERMKLLNTYFKLITRMEEVIKTKEFLKFFCLEQFLHLIPSKVGEITICCADSSLLISSLSVSEELVVVACSSAPSPLAKVTRIVSSWIGQSAPEAEGRSELEIWRRLPNSLLCERGTVITFQFRINQTLILPNLCTVLFATSDGRVGFFRWFRGVLESDSAESGFLHGMVHVGPTNVLHLDANGFLWSGGKDGLIQRFDLQKWVIVNRMSSNGESAGITAIETSTYNIFVGLSTGVINVFNVQTDSSLRLVTILQGPFTCIVSLFLSGSMLIATHSGGLLDSAEGVNTVQFWEISEVMSRGTSKLPSWGPITGSAVDCFQVSSDLLAVVSTNGAVNIFKPSLQEVTNRARFLFKATGQESTDYLPTHACGMSDRAIFLGCGRSVRIFKIPPFGPGDLDRIDMSSRDMCESVQRTAHVPRRHQTLSKDSREDTSDLDDLHSWAR
jgi:hypothetical protein